MVNKDCNKPIIKSISEFTERLPVILIDKFGVRRSFSNSVDNKIIYRKEYPNNQEFETVLSEEDGFLLYRGILQSLK